MNRTFSTPRALTLLALFTPLASLAASITGTVTDKTVNKPAAGDRVVLIQLQGGMKESNSTTTDAKGNFKLDLPDAGPHLIRVDHEKAGYFHIAPPGTQSVDIDVFDVAEKVEGVSTEANVMRIETGQQSLHVIENYFVKNASTPPRTQLSTHAYEIYLPEGAQVEGSAAMAPGGMPVASSPVPLGDKGHFAFVFPIRPGETRFQVSYRLPYTGSYKFSQKLALPAENVAIMLPKSMTFTPGVSTPFQPVNDDVNAQTFLARNVSTARPMEFTVAGTGAMPRDSQTQGSDAQGGPAASAGTTPGTAVPQRFYRCAGYLRRGRLGRRRRRYPPRRWTRQPDRFPRPAYKISLVDPRQPLSPAGRRRRVLSSQSALRGHCGARRCARRSVLPRGCGNVCQCGKSGARQLPICSAAGPAEPPPRRSEGGALRPRNRTPPGEINPGGLPSTEERL